MEIHLEHEIALKELGIPLKDYSKDIKQNVSSLMAMIKNHIGSKPDEEIDPAAVVRIEAKSAVIADEMQTFIEENLPDPEAEPVEAAEGVEEPNNNNQNQDNMLTGKDLERAQAVGLDASNTLEEVTAKENELAQAQAEKDALTARALAVNLPETATEEEVAAAESAAADKSAAEEAERNKPKPPPKPTGAVDYMTDLLDM